MTEPLTVGRLKVAAPLHAFLAREALPGTGLTEAAFWAGVEAILSDFSPRNAALLATRDQLQARIDAWWREHKGQAFDIAAHTDFLRQIGYLVAEPGAFGISTSNVDPEIASIAGPQLVVPVSNARYALNAANARWVSLYDALYGTDAVAPLDPSQRGYDAARGAKVIAYARGLLDEIAPLARGSHAACSAYAVVDGALLLTLGDGSRTGLRDAAAFAGWRGEAAAPSAILLRNNGLHLEISIDRSQREPIGGASARAAIITSSHIAARTVPPWKAPPG